MSDPTREELITLCERGIVAESEWHNRDTARSVYRLGKAWALLRAGCEWWVTDDPKHPGMIWIYIKYRGFMAFEVGEEGIEEELFYLPTSARLDAVAGKDWY